MKRCRISTCHRAASQRPSAHGFCVPCAWGWYFSQERRAYGPGATERFQRRREVQDLLRLPARSA